MDRELVEKLIGIFRAEREKIDIAFYMIPARKPTCFSGWEELPSFKI